MAEPNYQDILNRLTALETARVAQPEIDLSDPPLYLVKADGSPVSPDSIEKIPDLVKDLPTFSGNPNEIAIWIRDAEDLVSMYRPTNTSSLEIRNKFHMVCKTIRRKIRGEANDALVASNVNINWTLIRKTLETYYGEKRDIGTLDYQLMNFQQRGRSLEIYYDEINHLLSLIANQIQSDVRLGHPEASKAMIENFNDKALDAFVRGLDGDIGKFLKNYRPDSLACAYAYCISFQNIEFRKNLTRSKIPEAPQGPRDMIPQVAPPKLPSRTHCPQQLFQRHHFQQPFQRNPFQQPTFQQQFQRQSFQPQQQFQRQPFQQQFQRNPFQHFQRNPFQKPPQFPPRNNPRQPPPEPMDVDHSIHSKQINYSNRPQHSTQNNIPLKRQRVFNTETKQYEDPQQDLEVNGLQDYYPSEDEEYYPEETTTYERYVRQYEKQQKNEPEEEIENAELNFLG